MRIGVSDMGELLASLTLVFIGYICFMKWELKNQLCNMRHDGLSDSEIIKIVGIERFNRMKMV